MKRKQNNASGSRKKEKKESAPSNAPENKKESKDKEFALAVARIERGIQSQSHSKRFVSENLKICVS